MGAITRISVSLSERELGRLDYLAGRLGKPRAALATLLIAGGLEREGQRLARARTQTAADTRYATIDDVRADIMAALAVPGVPACLAGHWHGAPIAAKRATNYLENVSAWISDSRDQLEKGEPPRLAQTFADPHAGGGVAGALDLIDLAEALPAESVDLWELMPTADKHQLSELTRAGGGDEADGTP